MVYAPYTRVCVCCFSLVFVGAGLAGDFRSRVGSLRCLSAVSLLPHFPSDLVSPSWPATSYDSSLGGPIHYRPPTPQRNLNTTKVWRYGNAACLGVLLLWLPGAAITSAADVDALVDGLGPLKTLALTISDPGRIERAHTGRTYQRWWVMTC